MRIFTPEYHTANFQISQSGRYVVSEGVYKEDGEFRLYVYDLWENKCLYSTKFITFCQFVQNLLFVVGLDDFLIIFDLATGKKVLRYKYQRIRHMFPHKSGCVVGITSDGGSGLIQPDGKMTISPNTLGWSYTPLGVYNDHLFAGDDIEIDICAFNLQTMKMESWSKINTPEIFRSAPGVVIQRTELGFRRNEMADYVETPDETFVIYDNSRYQINLLKRKKVITSKRPIRKMFVTETMLFYHDWESIYMMDLDSIL